MVSDVPGNMCRLSVYTFMDTFSTSTRCMCTGSDGITLITNTPATCIMPMIIISNALRINLRRATPMGG